MKTEKLMKLTLWTQWLFLVILVTVGLWQFDRVFENFDVSSSFGRTNNHKESIEDSYSMQAKSVRSASNGGGVMSLLMSQANAQSEVKARIVKTGYLSARVDSLKGVKSALPDILQKHSAQLTSEQESNDHNSFDLSLVVRVPESSFTGLFEDLVSLGSYVSSKSVNLEDVTKQFVDTKSRIKTQDILLEKFRALLKKAKRVEDVLRIEQELAKVQRTSEQAQKELRALQDRISRSTIRVTYSELKPEAQKGPTLSFFREIWDGVARGWNRARSTVLFIISLWPFAVLAIIVIWWRRRRRRR